MLPLGEALVFYLKYMAEMNRLCHPEEGAGLTGLADPEQTQQMARAVGAVADQQAVDFVLECSRIIDAQFEGQGATQFSHRRSARYIRDYWGCGVRIHHSTIADGWFACGVYVDAPPNIAVLLPQHAVGLVIPWLWTKGGARGADRLRLRVAEWASLQLRDGLGEHSGTVPLAHIPVVPSPPDSFDVDRTALVRQVETVIAQVRLA